MLELSELLIYGTYYDTHQPYFEQQNIQLPYMDTDSFVLSVNTNNINPEGLKNLNFNSKFKKS